MKRRIAIWILIWILLLTGLPVPAGTLADGEHPITMTVTCDPMPELEGAGTVPDLKFTIRNNSDADYSLLNAKLSGGYEDVDLMLDESGDPITVIAGGTKEFDLYDVAVAEDQFDIDVIYTLSWDEAQTVFDEETGEPITTLIRRETAATILIERFIVPELTVSAFCEDALVRLDGEFTVEYTIKNDTLFDVTGLKLYEPEQSMLSIPLPKDTLTAGETIVVPVRYQMGTTDMSFCPTVEYVGRRRNLSETADERVTVGSVLTALEISSESHPLGDQGTQFFVTVKNNGNRTLTGVCIYDEINTPIEKPLDLAPGQLRTVEYTVQSAPSSDVIRTVRFHATATDVLNETFTVNDSEAYKITPFVDESGVHIDLAVEPQKPYYDENGKLCASFQFIIRCYGGVKLRNAVLTEETIFRDVVHYAELLNGESYYYTQTYQIDGIETLRFAVTATDPANQEHRSASVTVDLNALRHSSDTKTDPVYVYTTNPYMQDLDAKFRSILKVIAVIGLCVAAFCAIVCIVLYAVELRIRQKLPGEFEEDLEKALSATKRRMDDQLFSDAPTERFGYRPPTKLRSFGELTEAEAKARRELYAKEFAEDLRREGTPAAAKPVKPAAPVRIDSDGTRVLPTAKAGARAAAETTVSAKPKPPVRPESDAAFRRPAGDTTVMPRSSEPITHPSGDTTVMRKPAEPIKTRLAGDTTVTRKPAEPIKTRPAGDTTVTRKPAEPITHPSGDTTVTRKPAEPITRPAGDATVMRRPSDADWKRPPEDPSVKSTVLPRPEGSKPAPVREPVMPVTTAGSKGVPRVILPPPAEDASSGLRRSAGLGGAAEGTTYLHRAGAFDEPPKPELAPEEPKPAEAQAVPEPESAEAQTVPEPESAEAQAVPEPESAEAQAFPSEEKMSRLTETDEVSVAAAAVPIPEQEEPKQPEAFAPESAETQVVPEPESAEAHAFPSEGKVSRLAETDEVSVTAAIVPIPEPEEPKQPEEEAAEAPEPISAEPEQGGTPGTSSPTEPFEQETAPEPEPEPEEAPNVPEPISAEAEQGGTPGTSSPTVPFEQERAPKPETEEPEPELETEEAQTATEPRSDEPEQGGTPGTSSPTEPLEQETAPKPEPEPEPEPAIVFPIPSFLRPKVTVQPETEPEEPEPIPEPASEEQEQPEPESEEPAQEEPEQPEPQAFPSEGKVSRLAETNEVLSAAAVPIPEQEEPKQPEAEAAEAPEPISVEPEQGGTPGTASPTEPFAPAIPPEHTESNLEEPEPESEEPEPEPKLEPETETVSEPESEPEEAPNVPEPVSAEPEQGGTPGTSSPTEPFEQGTASEPAEPAMRRYMEKPIPQKRAVEPQTPKYMNR